MEARYEAIESRDFDMDNVTAATPDLTSLNASFLAGNVTDDTSSSSQTIERTLLEVILLGTLLGLISLLTILGNLLVMVAVLTNKKLQCPTNYFILSLATTDFCLGSLVLPFSAVNTLSSTWPLGSTFCNIFMSTDVMLCTVSILNLFSISLDRYFAVTAPMRYQGRISCRLVWKTCACIWVFSFAMAFIPIHLGLNSMDGRVQNVDRPDVCLFELNKVYALLVAVLTYFAPLFIMCAVYMRILLITRHQVEEINKLTKAGQATIMLTPGESRRRMRLASDTKATVTLASLVLAFAICWVPYFGVFTAKPFISHEVNIYLDLFALWLGYVNSLINPFLYAYYNSTFREAFARILCRPCATRSSYRTRLKAHHPTSFTDSSELSALNGRTSV